MMADKGRRSQGHLQLPSAPLLPGKKHVRREYRCGPNILKKKKNEEEEAIVEQPSGDDPVGGFPQQTRAKHKDSFF